MSSSFEQVHACYPRCSVQLITHFSDCISSLNRACLCFMIQFSDLFLLFFLNTTYTSVVAESLQQPVFSRTCQISDLAKANRIEVKFELVLFVTLSHKCPQGKKSVHLFISHPFWNQTDTSPHSRFDLMWANIFFSRKRQVE